MSGIKSNEGVSNNAGHRNISNKADEKYFKDHPKQRAAVHSIYHGAVGVAKLLVGNKKGADAEFNRANEQKGKMRNPSP